MPSPIASIALTTSQAHYIYVRTSKISTNPKYPTAHQAEHSLLRTLTPSLSSIYSFYALLASGKPGSFGLVPKLSFQLLVLPLPFLDFELCFLAGFLQLLLLPLGFLFVLLLDLVQGGQRFFFALLQIV